VFASLPLHEYLPRKILGHIFEGLLVLKCLSVHEVLPWQNIPREGLMTSWDDDSMTCSEALPLFSLLFVLLPDSPVESSNDHLYESVKIQIQIVLCQQLIICNDVYFHKTVMTDAPGELWAWDVPVQSRPRLETPPSSFLDRLQPYSRRAATVENMSHA
jgi:hypothetical protein